MPEFTPAPSRVLPGRWCVYNQHGQVMRKRSRIAVFNTCEEAVEFAGVLTRRRNSPPR